MLFFSIYFYIISIHSENDKKIKLDNCFQHA